MVAKKSNTKRKRSRPVEKRGKTILLMKNRRQIGFILLVAIVVVAIVGIYYYTSDNETIRDNEVEGNPIAVMDTTMGTIKIELFEDKVPNTVANFIKLVTDGFYDGMNFYRVLDGFMIQAGRYYPDGSQKQSPYGTIEFETHPDVRHIDGTISMARGDDLNSASSEFFICDGDQPELDDNYAAFGVVIDGIEVVHNIADQPNDGAHPAGGGRPYTDIVIKSVTIEYQ